MTDNKKHLHYMNELSDYKISDGYPDIRGWDVKDLNNRVIGKVDNLLVNIDAQRVVYLDVDVDKSIIDAKHDPYGRPSNAEVREFVNKDGENHIIIPIGLVDLNSDSNYVYTDVLDHQTFAETKRYRKGDNIERAYENQVLNSYDRRSSFKRSEDTHLMDDNENDNEFLNTNDRRTISDRSENRNLMDDNNFQDDHDNDFLDTNDRRTTSDRSDDGFISINEDIEDGNTNMNESRIRGIVREEIRKYHENNDTYRNQSNDNMDRDRRRYQNDNDIDDSIILSDEESELQRRRQNDDLYDDDRFYDRREFDDKRLRDKRTPGL